MKISYIQKRPCTAEKVGWNLLPPLSSILSNSVHEYVFLYFITLLYEYVLLFFITLLYDYHHDFYNFFNFKPIFPILDQDGPDLVRLSQSFKTNLEQQNNKQSVQPWNKEAHQFVLCKITAVGNKRISSKFLSRSIFYKGDYNISYH